MPAALTVDSVDQSLVDDFLARVDRFVDNVNRLHENIMEQMNNRFGPAVPEKEEPMYEETAAVSQPEQAVVTADDIDIDALLAEVDLSDMGMSM